MIEPVTMVVIAACVVLLLLVAASTEAMLWAKRYKALNAAYKKDGDLLALAITGLRGIEAVGLADLASDRGALVQCVACKSEANSGIKIPHAQKCPVGSAARVLRDMRAM